MLPKIGTYARQHHLALVALFIALGGTSYAAAKLPKNSVGSKQIRRSAVSSPKVKNGSLLTEDFKAGSIPQGKTGDKGAKGDPGSNGQKGDPGPTQAVASQTSEATPSGYNINATKIITTTTAGKLWVEGEDNYQAVGCTSGTYSVALFVDGTYVLGTRRDLNLPDTVTVRSTASTLGVTDSLPAASHTVTLRGQLLGCTGSFGIDSVVGAIALGG